MAVSEILQLGNPKLRAVSEAVAEPDAPPVKTLAEDLRDTLLDHRQKWAYGRGIAAPQLGTLQRVVQIEFDGPETLVNPVITARSDETMEIWDFCFSYFSIFFPVRRNVLVEVKYQDVRGHDRRIEAVGDLAELLQHEIDHLNGVLAIDLVSDVKRICSFEEWRLRHAHENAKIVADAIQSLKG